MTSSRSSVTGCGGGGGGGDVGGVHAVGTGSVLAGRSATGRASGVDGQGWNGCVGSGPASSARVIESRAPTTAVAHPDPQGVHVAEAAAAAGCRSGSGSSLAQTMGVMGPSSASMTWLIRISVGSRDELVAAAGAAGAGDQARLAQADDELLQVRSGQVLVIGHLAQGDRARRRGGGPAPP